MIWLVIAFIAAGLVSGYLAGLFGIGGGILRVPLFVLLFTQFGVDESVVMHLAAGTSLSLVIPSAIAAVWKQHRMGKFDFAYYKTWAAYVLAGVIVGVILLPHITTRYLEGVFVVFLLGVSGYVGLVPEHIVLADVPPHGWKKGIYGTVIGALSVLIGIGGGVFTTPVMKAHRMSIHRAIALAVGTTLVVGTAGTVGAIVVGLGAPGRSPSAIGFVDPIAFAAMVLPVLFCAPLGVRTANWMDKVHLRWMYAIFLLLMAGYMAWNLLK